MSSESIWEIVILAMIALFLVWRLGSVLGRRTGHEQPRNDSFTGTERQGRPTDSASERDKVVTLPGRQGPEIVPDAASSKSEPGVAQGITQIRIADPSFDPSTFAGGAGQAFGMIVTAFAEGDTGTLRPLLSDDLYDEFSEAIRTRLNDGDTLENRIETIKSAQIVDARMEGRTAFVTVKFESTQINVTRDVDGEVTDGDPETAIDVTDLWTFARNTRATDPNWTLVETDTPT